MEQPLTDVTRRPEASATKASAEKGKLLAERIGKHILNIIEAEFPA
jgi:hypothetical protein